MKRVIIVLVSLLLIVITSFAQNRADSTEHLAFKGVPIDGTLNEFVLNLKKKGFTHVGTEDGVAMLKGDFAGYKNCIVGISTLKQKDLVTKITVVFPEQNRWSNLSSDYFILKELLIEKYGEPSESVEEFKSSIKPKDDNDKMYEIMENKCNYYTTFEINNGSIQLSIDHKFIHSFVMLTYYDKINVRIIRTKAIDDL